jgi:6-pyruvoyltetrahydropterin/6-carboxytetrahydropterin synthase
MQTTLTKSFTFDAAHWLPRFPDGHKCRRLHGHTFRVDVILEGDVPADRGYLVDFGDIKRAIEPVRDRLDHHLLNEVAGLDNPTVEVLSRWIFEQLKPALPQLAAVRVFETADNVGEYRPR